MTQATTSPHWRERVHNCLLLAGYADAIASPLAGQHLPAETAVDQVMRSPTVRVPLSYATSQAMTVAEHLASRQGRLDEDALARALAQQYWARHRIDRPTGSRQVLADIHAGTAWRDSASKIHHGQGSYGTTAAVRATTFGLLPQAGLPALADLARRSAAITHAHPIAGEAAAAAAIAVSLAVRSRPGQGLDTVRFLDAVHSHVRSAELRAALRIAATLLRHRAGAVETAATLNSGPTALRTMPAALVAYLRYPDQPLAAIRYALLIGGQTRQIAAMTAAMSGARCPHFPIPASWRPALLNVGGVRIAAHQMANVVAR